MKILATSRSAEHGFSKVPQPRIVLVAGEGVEGDAHRGATVQHLYLKRKNAAAPNLCQVHLFADEMLTELAAHGFVLHAGEMGENLLTAGIELLTLPRGTRLHLGGSDGGASAVIEITGLRTPCVQIDGFRRGLQQHLWGEPTQDRKKQRRAGVMAIVLQGGVVQPGDTIRVELPAQPHQALGPV